MHFFSTVLHVDTRESLTGAERHARFKYGVATFSRID